MDNLSFNSDLYSYFEPLDPQAPPVQVPPEFETETYIFENQPLDEYTYSTSQDIEDLFDSLLGPRTASEAELPEHISTIYPPTSPSINKENQHHIYARPDIKKIELALPNVYYSLNSKNIEELETGIPQLAVEKYFLELALQFSIRKNWAEGVVLLLKNGADPNWIDPRSGSSAINCARYASYSKIFFPLLDAGANLSVINNKNTTVLHHAASFGPLKVVEKICELAPILIGIKNGEKETPLDLALKKNIHTGSNRKSIIEHLSGKEYKRERLPRPRKRSSEPSLKKDPISLFEKINAIPDENKQCFLDLFLHKAIKLRWIEGVEILLEKGASANSKNPSSQNTALQVALFDGYSSIINLLFEHGARVGQLSGNGLTTLHLAAKRSPISIIKKILEKDPKALLKIDVNGQTPLHVALSRKKVISAKGISALLKHVKSPEIFLIRDNKGNQPKDLCENIKIKQAIQDRYELLVLQSSSTESQDDLLDINEVVRHLLG